jgi:hypothetical protein
MFSSRTSIAALAALALTSVSGAGILIPASASPPMSDYCTASDPTHLSQSADTAANWLASCHFNNGTTQVPRQPYYCTHAHLPYIPHTADAIAEWLSACEVVKRQGSKFTSARQGAGRGSAVGRR